MICCGSGYDYRKVLIPVPVPAPAPAPVPAPDPSNIHHSFPKTKNFAQNLTFLMSEAAYFSESWPLIFNFFTFLLHSMLDPDPNPVPEPEP
jgi:hypothetical protein